MTTWKLLDAKTGTELKFGDKRTCRGEAVTITGFQPPHKPESSGRVFVNFVSDGVPGHYYPSVIDARYEEVQS